MNILESLKNQLRSKKQSESSDAWSRYRQLLRSIDKDEPLDIDDAQAILDAVGKSWSQLEDEDLPKYRKRLELQRQVEVGNAASTRIAKETHRLESLRAELESHTSRLQPQIADANRLVRSLEDQQSQGSYASDQLWRTCPDESLLAKYEATQNEINRLLGERQSINEILQDSRLGSVASSLGQAETQLAFWSARVRDTYGKDEYDLKQRDQWQETVDHLQLRQSKAKQVLDVVDADIAKLRADQDRLREQMQDP